MVSMQCNAMGGGQAEKERERKGPAYAYEYTEVFSVNIDVHNLGGKRMLGDKSELFFWSLGCF